MNVPQHEDEVARIRALRALHGDEIIQCIESEDVSRLKAIASEIFQEKMCQRIPKEDYAKLSKLVQVVNGLFHSVDFSAKKIYKYISEKGLIWNEKTPLIRVDGYSLSEIDECIHGTSVQNKTSKDLMESSRAYVAKNKEEFLESIEKSKSALYDIGYLLAKVDIGFASHPGESTSPVSFVGDNPTRQEKDEDFAHRPYLLGSLLEVLDDQEMDILKEVSDRVKLVCQNQFESFLKARFGDGDKFIRPRDL